MKRSDPTHRTGSLANESLWPIGPERGQGWHLSPEGAAVHLDERTAVVADVHLGYEWARGFRGDMVPAHSLLETLEKLSTLLLRSPINRLIVAGDLVESRRPCARTRQDVKALNAWLQDRGVEIVALQGNHDPPSNPPCPASLDLGGWTITHGHRAVDFPRLMIGHHHPSLRFDGLSAPCFLVSESLLVLPAFSGNAAGLDVGSSALPDPLRSRPFRVVAGLDGLLLDFGLLSEVRSRLHEGPARE